MEKTYYMVKPEFDNFRLQISMPGRRCKIGFRMEYRTFIGGEILSKEQHKYLISRCPKLCDFFKEIKRDPDLIFWSFGIKESLADMVSSEDKDSARRLRKSMISRLIILYQKAEIYIAKEILQNAQKFSNISNASQTKPSRSTLISTPKF